MPRALPAGLFANPRCGAGPKWRTPRPGQAEGSANRCEAREDYSSSPASAFGGITLTL